MAACQLVQADLSLGHTLPCDEQSNSCGVSPSAGFVTGRLSAGIWPNVVVGLSFRTGFHMGAMSMG